MGLSGLVLAASSPATAWAQQASSCVLTPEAGQGPFYLDPKLIRSDITSKQPGAPLELALQVVRSGDWRDARQRPGRSLSRVPAHRRATHRCSSANMKP